MYSVYRFVDRGSTTALELLERIHTRAEYVSADLRHGGDGVCGELSSSPTWEDHRGAILKWLTALEWEISWALQRDFSVAIDVAIEPEDLAGSSLPTILVDTDLAEKLSTNGVILEITIYA